MKYITRGEGKRRIEFHGDAAPEGWILIDNEQPVKRKRPATKVTKKKATRK